VTQIQHQRANRHELKKKKQIKRPTNGEIGNQKNKGKKLKIMKDD